MKRPLRKGRRFFAKEGFSEKIMRQNEVAAEQDRP